MWEEKEDARETLSETFLRLLSIICKNPAKQKVIAPTQVCSNISVYSKMSHSESNICALRFTDK